MSGPNRSQLSGLRGATRMVVDATVAIAEVVEDMHRTIRLRPAPFGVVPVDRLTGVAGLTYRMVLGCIRLAGHAVDAGLAGIAEMLPQGEPTLARDEYRAMANGVYGDYLLRTGNPLAIDMSLRLHGRRVDLDGPMPVVDEAGGVVPGKLLVLVHGLCMNERQWNRDGHDHGAELAREMGYVPLYLRYNSGLNIASNGRGFAQMLESLLANWATPVNELVVIGYSMGGLVARSACFHGRRAGHAWPDFLRKLMFLGTPHHGVPLERGGHGLDLVMQSSPYAMPLTRLSKARSAGIADLRRGAVADGDETVPLPDDVKCYAAGAVRAAKRSMLSERLIGDGLVPLDSALGCHRDTAQALIVPKSRQWVGYQMGHFDLLSSPELYRQLSAWLQEPD